MNPYAWPRSASVAAVLFIVIATGFLLKTAQPILVPLALAILLAFLLHPLVKRLVRVGLNRIVAVIAVVGMASVVMVTLGFIVSSQVKTLVDDLPNHGPNIEQRVLVLKRYLRGGTFERLQEMVARINHSTEQRVKHEEQARGETPPEPLPSAAADADLPEVTEGEPQVAVQVPPGTKARVRRERPSVGDAPAEATIEVESTSEAQLPVFGQTIMLSALDVLASAGIVVLLVVFFLIQQADIRDRIVSVAGRGALATTTKALDDAGARISRYLLMQFIINATFGGSVAIGLAIIGVPYAMMFGLCAALLRYIPYIGPWVAALLPIVTSLVVEQGWGTPLAVIGLFIVLELISNNVMEPILYGHSVGLSEVGVILSAVFWAWIWGPIGLMLATPMTVCLVVLGKYIPGLSLFNHLLGERPPMNDSVRIYQRLLARDDEEAEEIVEQALKRKKVLEVADQLILPTVELMHSDAVREQVDEDDSERMLRSMQNLIDEMPDWMPRDAETRERVAAAARDTNRPVVVGIPGHTEREELLLDVVALAVEDLGCRFEVVSHDLLVSERLARLAELQPIAVCLSSLPPGDLAYTRQLCKRIRQQRPSVKLIVGRWSSTDASADRNEQLRQAGADQVVSTVDQMHGAVQSAINLRRAARPAPREADADAEELEASHSH
ncbi:MAG: AI-2E family transporter [Planctomyces sp.]|nr:AI-2E family transporter [Planctomyces sp.]